MDSDVVVVDGLDNYLYKTWMHPNGPLWLRDSQPDQLPSTRVMKFGYDAKHPFDQSLSPLKRFITSRSDTFVTSQLNSINIVLTLDKNSKASTVVSRNVDSVVDTRISELAVTRDDLQDDAQVWLKRHLKETAGEMISWVASAL